MKTRTWFRVHSFTGVITGLLLFVICWSGTFAVLSHEIDRLITPEIRVEPTGERASWGTLFAAVEAAYPGSEVTGIYTPPTDDAETTAPIAYVDRPDGTSMTVRVNPYTAEVRGAHVDFNVGRFFRDFHTHLFSLGLSQLGYGSRFGSYLVEFFGVIMLVSLASALYFYRRWWTRFFDFRWTRSGRAFWSQFHKLGGLWSLWFFLIISVTGVWYLYETGQRDVTGGPVNYAGVSDFAAVHVPAPTSDSTKAALPLDTLVAKAQSAFPRLKIRTVSHTWYSQDGMLYLDGQTDFPLVRHRANQIWLDERTGEVLMQHSASEIPAYWVWSNMADPLHFGYFGGLASKLIWFVFGLVLCGLILTGTYLHARRLGREAGGPSRYRWAGTSAAVIVTLVILLAAVPYGFYQQVLGYGSVVDGTQQWPALDPGVVVVIVGWTVLTLAIIAGWVWMLWKPEMLGPKTARRDSPPEHRKPDPDPRPAKREAPIGRPVSADLPRPD
jgi:uncharacterized iron-regulated membrane protein